MFGLNYSIFSLLVIGFMLVVFRLTYKKLTYYKKIGYQYDIKLGNLKNFLTIAGGGFIWAFYRNHWAWIRKYDSQCTTCGGYRPKGYNQIVFIGAASLIEALVNQ